MTAKSLLRHPRLPFAFVSLASLGLVGGGILMGNLLGLAACPLCIIQRLLYMVLVLTGALGLVLAGSGFGRRLAALASAVAAGTGLFVAGYQTWIQRFAPEVKCSAATTWWEDLVDWLGEQAPQLFLSNGLCSDPAWKLFGLSIAEYSLMAFTVFTLISLWALFRRR